MSGSGVPTGIAWSRSGDTVTGRVIAQYPDGGRERLATITYTLEQAAQVAAQLLDAIGGRS